MLCKLDICCELTRIQSPDHPVVHRASWPEAIGTASIWRWWRSWHSNISMTLSKKASRLIDLIGESLTIRHELETGWGLNL